MSAPSTPATPTPANGATGVSTTAPALSWTAAGATSCQMFLSPFPPGGDAVIGGVKFPAQGFASPWPPGTWTRNGVGSLSGGTFTFDEEPNTAGVQPMPPLRGGTTWYWQVYAFNVDGMTAGPVWRFTTQGMTVSAPSPTDASTSVGPSLSWSPTGASGTPTFDVYFDTVNPPVALVASGITATSYTAPVAAYSTTYYWRIVAHDATNEMPYALTPFAAVAGTGPVWSFTTPAGPSLSSPVPADASLSDFESVSWSVSNVIGTPTFDVYFDTVTPPVALVSSGQTATSYTPGTLTPGTLYYWRIVVHDAGATTTGPVWSFTGDTMTLDHNVTTTDVVNTLTETTVYSFTVPAGTLSTNRALRLAFAGDYLNNSGANANVLVQVKYGGVQVLFANLITITTNANRRSLLVDAIVSAAGSTSAQVARGRFSLALGDGVVLLGAFTDLFGKNTVAVNSAVDQALVITITHSVAAATISGRSMMVHLEKL